MIDTVGVTISCLFYLLVSARSCIAFTAPVVVVAGTDSHAFFVYQVTFVGDDCYNGITAVSGLKDEIVCFALAERVTAV